MAVSGIISEPMLRYTDHVASLHMAAEKRIEKERRRTQKHFHEARRNRQDYQTLFQASQVSNNGRITSNPETCLKLLAFIRKVMKGRQGLLRCPVKVCHHILRPPKPHHVYHQMTWTFLLLTMVTVSYKSSFLLILVCFGDK